MTSRRTYNALGFEVVRLRHVWDVGKVAVLSEMAKQNAVTLAAMVDIILDDWAARAGEDIGISHGQRRLELPSSYNRPGAN